MTGSILHFMSMSSFATCRKPRCIYIVYIINIEIYIYIFHLGTANTPAQANSEILSKYVYIHRYTSVCGS